jgi:hypothetical protein
MPGVVEVKDEWLPRRKEWIAQTRKSITELSERTPEERLAWIKGLQEKRRNGAPSAGWRYPSRARKTWGWAWIIRMYALFPAGLNF